MTRSEFEQHAKLMCDAWNRQDVEAVLDRYTEDVAYRDPNTNGTVEGRGALRRYLTALFSRWTMHWEWREYYLFAAEDGAAVLWRARLAPANGDRAVEVDGMDLILMDGDKVRRNEVRFDRAVLAELFADAGAAA